MSRFRRLYGSGPIHALLMGGGFAFAGYLIALIFRSSEPLWILVWLAGAIVAHDLVLFPLYSALHAALDRINRRRRPGSRTATAVPLINHVRVPAMISGVLLLITFPLVLRLSEAKYAAATGLTTSVYLGRWIVITAVLFAGSAVLYAGRRWHAGTAARLVSRQRCSALVSDEHGGDGAGEDHESGTPT